jgi:glycine hydroxymethyltransferase
MNEPVSEADPEIAAAIERELQRQQNTLCMIPSENHAPRAVLEVQGSVLTNKYAEGYPGARWYHGCEYVDEAESLAIQRVKQLFGAEHANVQPHAGASANLAGYMAVLKPGETILAMSVDQGGHLTHGNRNNYSARFYKVVPYGVDPNTHVIDMKEVRRLALEHRPQLIVVGASAYPRLFDFSEWRAIADEAGCLLMADIAHFAGLVAAGVHPDPVPYCDLITSTTHKTLRGPRGAFILCREGRRRAIDVAVFPGVQGGPLMHVIAAKAVCFKLAMQPDFKVYGRQIVANCKALADQLMKEGLSLISGGTDNHLLLVDLRPLDMTGQRAADTVREVGIVANKNLIPYDPRRATETSGLRLGTPALTTRGMGENEMRQLGSLIARLILHPADEGLKEKATARVSELCQRFPVPVA